MNNKIIYSTVMYDCQNFDIFINDYLKSVFCQTDNDFELLIVIDNANEDYINNKIMSIIFWLI